MSKDTQQLILLGKNAGISKLTTAITTGKILLSIESFVKNVDEPDYDKLIENYIVRLFSGKCPYCGNTHIILNPYVKNDEGELCMFWGCHSCKFGNWEKFLPYEQIKTFTTLHKLEYNIRLYPIPDKKIVKRGSKKKQQVNKLQLTLF